MRVWQRRRWPCGVHSAGPGVCAQPRRQQHRRPQRGWVVLMGHCRAAAGQHAWSISPARIFYSGDGQTIVAELAGTSGPSAAVTVYAAKTGHKLMAMENVETSTAISRDGAVLATIRWIEPDHYQAIVLWDTAAGKELHELAAEIQTRLPLAGGRGHHIVQDMAFSPDGRTSVSTGPMPFACGIPPPASTSAVFRRSTIPEQARSPGDRTLRASPPLSRAVSTSGISRRILLSPCWARPAR